MKNIRYLESKELLQGFDDETTKKKTENFIKKQIKEEERVRKMARPLAKLVVEEEFMIKGIYGQTYDMQVTPYSEMIIGGHSPKYRTGYTGAIILSVLPQREGVSVNTLTFNGYAPFRFGETILAKIPRYKEIELPRKEGFPTFFSNMGNIETLYLDRKFNTKEEAIELSSLNRRETFKSATYSNFLKK
jgi:hypothetical protein